MNTGAVGTRLPCLPRDIRSSTPQSTVDIAIMRMAIGLPNKPIPRSPILIAVMAGVRVPWRAFKSAADGEVRSPAFPLGRSEALKSSTEELTLSG